jgi:hypothetical protein
MKESLITLGAFVLVIFASLSFAGKDYSEIPIGPEQSYHSLSELRQRLHIQEQPMLVDSPVLPRPDTIPKPMPPSPDSIPVTK